MKFLLKIIYCIALIFGLGIYNVYSQTDSKLENWIKKASEYRYSNPDSVKYYCNKILQTVGQTPKSKEKAEALRILSMSYEAQGDYTDALKYSLLSLELWREIDDKSKIANTINGIGIIYDQQGKFDEALKYYNEAYAIYKSLGDNRNLAMMDINLGILFKSQGQYKQVIENYQAAYTAYKKLNLSEEIAFCEANLGSIYYYTKQYDSCIYYSQKAEKALLEQKNLQFLPVAQANAGLGLLAKNKLADAKNYLVKALTKHRKFGNKKETSFVLIHLARLHQQQGKHNEAFQALTEAKQLAKSINSPQQHMDASKLLADHYAKFDDFKNAYQEYLDYSKVKDTLFQQQKNKEITNHQVRYETQRKEQAIELLTQENQINELALKQRNLYLIIALLLVGITSFIAWFIHRTRKLKERQLKKEAAMQSELLLLEAQNELQKDRLRISRDLHDNIGANLTYIHTTVNAIQTNNRHLADIKSLVNETILELRRTVWMINKPSITLEEWLVKLREYYSRIDKITISSTIENETENQILTSKEGTALFRIVQEATNNSLKHSKATQIIVHVNVKHHKLQIHIKDNGIGFENNTAKASFGLKNMKQHALEIDANYTLFSKVQEGTDIQVELTMK